MALIQSGFSQADLAKMTPQDVARRRRLSEQLMGNQPKAQEMFGVLANALTGARSGYEDTVAREGESTNMSRIAHMLQNPEAQDNNALMGAAMDPWASGQQSAMVNALLGERRADENRQQGWAREDARYAQGAPMRDLDMEYKRAQIAKLMGEAQNPGGDATFGLNPIWGTDENGNPVIAQLSNRGGAQPVQMPEGVTFGKDPIRMDAGDRWVLMDPVTRQPIGEIPKSGDVPTGFGQTPGGGIAPMTGGPQDIERRMESSQAEQRARAADARADVVKNAIDTALGQANWYTTGPVGSAGRAVGATPMVDLEKTIDTIKSNIGFNELQQMREASPTGGALGQVAVQELNMLQSVIGSLDPRQGEDQLKANLKTISDLMERQKMFRAEALKERQQIMGGGASGGGQPARIQSDADYDALPSGATFIAPDGTTRSKP